MPLRVLLTAWLALATFTAALSLPPPPPPAHETAFLRDFFRALPRLPPPDMERLARYVSPEVEVYREGVLEHGNREQWFEHLRSLGARPDISQGVSISREGFYRAQDGAIVVLEFRWPLGPEGREAEVTFHVDDPFELVTYRFEGEQLVRVDHGPRMRSYDEWLRENDAAGTAGAGEVRDSSARP